MVCYVQVGWYFMTFTCGNQIFHADMKIVLFEKRVRLNEWNFNISCLVQRSEYKCVGSKLKGGFDGKSMKPSINVH